MEARTIDEIKKDMHDWFNSEAGQKYFYDLTEKHKILEKRFLRFEKWLIDNDFDKLMYRLINEHNDDYAEKCYHNGCEPYPNNKLSFLLSYITRDGISHPIEVKKIKVDFPNDIWEFKGYYFQFIFGQGTMIRIYNKDDMRLLLQL